MDGRIEFRGNHELDARQPGFSFWQAREKLIHRAAADLAKLMTELDHLTRRGT